MVPIGGMMHREAEAGGPSLAPRLERLRGAVLDGSYDPEPMRVAEAILGRPPASAVMPGAPAPGSASDSRPPAEQHPIAEEDRGPDTRRLALAASLDRSNAEQLGDAIDRALFHGKSRVEIDFSGVGHGDLLAVRVLAKLRRRMLPKDGSIILIGAEAGARGPRARALLRVQRTTVGAEMRP